MTRSFLPVLIFALAFGSPALADDADDIQGQAAAFERAVNSGDVEGMTAPYTEDAILLPPDAPAVQGMEDIRAFWQQMADAGAADLKITPQETNVLGDHAYRVISFTFRAGPEDADRKSVV
jgi:uncharacterized protein (TIGR02246 family)